MWTVEMNRCITCPLVDTCEDRKKILVALSQLTTTINTDPNRVTGGKGVIIVACR